MKILNFGSCNIDYVYSMEHIVRVGETQSTYKMEVFPGGKGLNQSIAIARAGAPVYHAGCVGADGEILTALLAENGVNLTHLRTVDAKNGHAIIQVSSKGENSIFLYGGSNEMITEEFVNEVLEHFDAEDILVLQNEINNISYLMRKAHEKGMCIVFNPSPLNEKIKELDFSAVSYLILNEIESCELAGSETPEQALAYFKEHFPDLKVILTLGESGSVYADSERQIYQHAYTTEAVDTTAAGDTFMGYFVAGLFFGDDYADSLNMASAAASIAVSRKGAAPSIPYRQEVIEALDSLTYYKNKKALFCRKIDVYIREHMRDGTLADFARSLNYSAIYTGALVKKHTGKTFSALLQRQRIAKAAQMLLETELPINEIISCVGYENKSFFRKKFLEIYGVNPREFRNRGNRT